MICSLMASWNSLIEPSEPGGKSLTTFNFSSIDFFDSPGFVVLISKILVINTGKKF